MALINWTLVEQRRVDLGLSRRNLARRSGITERTLLAFDGPAPYDGGVTVAQLQQLAGALDLPTADLLRGEDEDGQQTAALRYYTDLARRPAAPLTRFAGTAELSRAELTTNDGGGGDDATLLAALHLIAVPVDPGALANALDWPADRLALAYRDAAQRLRGSGLRLRTDQSGRWVLSTVRTTLTATRRRAVRMCGLHLDAAAAATLWTLYRDGPLRLDQPRQR